MSTVVYIDGANLHQGAKERGGIDYIRFQKRLKDKYKITDIYLFIGYIKEHIALYSLLEKNGYSLIYKETLHINGKIKGNCDAELILQAVSNFYEKEYEKNIVITGDGDFGCLIDFYKRKKQSIILLAPNKKYCSYLLKKRNIPLVFLEEQKNKFKKNPQ